MYKETWKALGKTDTYGEGEVKSTIKYYYFLSEPDKYQNRRKNITYEVYYRGTASRIPEKRKWNYNVPSTKFPN